MSFRFLVGNVTLSPPLLLLSLPPFRDKLDQKGGDVMDFKVKIDCCSCGCAFELRATNFRPNPKLNCPNCGRAFPQAEYDSLVGALSKLSAVPAEIWAETDGMTYDSDHLFSLRVVGPPSQSNSDEET